MRSAIWAALAIAWIASCAGTTPPPRLPSHPAPVSASAPAVRPSASAAALAPTRVDAEIVPQVPPAPVFPPLDFTPPHERSAQPGDGRWQRLGDPALGERIAEGPAVMVRTVVRPHPISKWITVTVVAIDLDRTLLHHVPGSEDVSDLHVDADRLPTAPGLVPARDQDALLAVFNGGFKPRHGRWGMRAGAQDLVPPRDTGCTVAIYTAGGVRIRSWPELVEGVGDISAYRQGPPCLLEQGTIHPDLLTDEDGVWAGKDPKLQTRRRSALGIDTTGRILFYGIGEEAKPRELAAAMHAVGCHDAVELDINWSWTRFLIFGQPKPGAALQVTSTLIPKMVHQSRGTLTRPEERDFFYLTRRPP
jgi:hypothetical protein